VRDRGYTVAVEQSDLTAGVATGRLVCSLGHDVGTFAMQPGTRPAHFLVTIRLRPGGTEGRLGDEEVLEFEHTR
jgi:hypothetical protein